MNWPTNSAPYGYGGRSAATTVLPVRITMFPTSSSRDLVGKKVFSATARTIYRISSRMAAAPPARLKDIQTIGPLFENTTLNLRVTPGQPTRVGPDQPTGVRLDCRWYLAAALSGSDRESSARRNVMRRGAGLTLTIVAAATAAVALAACGSGARQDAGTPSGTFPVEVTAAKWRSAQRLAQHT